MRTSVWANALLSDGKILFWFTGIEYQEIWDFNMDFYFADINLMSYIQSHKLELVKQKFDITEEVDNNMIFEVLAPKFYSQWELSPDTKGCKPY